MHRYFEGKKHHKFNWSHNKDVRTHETKVTVKVYRQDQVSQGGSKVSLRTLGVEVSSSLIKQQSLF